MIPEHFSRLALSLAVAAGGALAAGMAAAQEDLTNLGIEEMVVTAQKREENLQAVPISISALSATDIERRGVQNSADLVSTIPNMGGFTSPSSRGVLAINLRGVGSPAPSNLSNDPGEVRSLADRDPALAERLRRTLGEWLDRETARTGAVGPGDEGISDDAGD